MDSVRKETHVVSATDPIVDRRHNRPLLAQKRGHRLTEKNLRKVLVPEEGVLLEGKAGKREESARIRRVIFGILPYVKITSLYLDANMVTVVSSDRLRLVGSPERSRRKVV